MRLNRQKIKKGDILKSDNRTGKIHAIPNDLTDAHFVLSQLMGLESSFVDYQNLFISRKDLEEQFEPVDDFSYLAIFGKEQFEGDKNARPNGEVVYKEGKHIYKHKTMDLYMDTYCKMEYISGESKETQVSHIFYQPLEIKQLIEFCEKFLFHKVDNDSSITLVVKTPQGFKFKTMSIKPLDVDLDLMYNDDFKEIHEHLVDSLKNKDRGIAMLHGEAGSGKTNYIKHLTTLVPQKKFVFVPSNLIPSLADPSFIEKLVENKGCILVLEDCENYLKDRNETGSSVVSTVLNISDGILSDILGIQMICTFNAKMSKIDSALRRKGRLIDDYEFGKLSVEKAQALMRHNKVDYHVTEKMTLSEVFNVMDKAHLSDVGERKTIGFSK